MKKLELTPLFSVLGIDVSYLKSYPPILTITVYGTTSTSGWTNIKLVPRTYVTPPEDGIQEFDLMGIPPQDFVLQVVTQVTSEPFLWSTDSMPNWVRGIKVYASDNSVIKPFLTEAANALPFYLDAENEKWIGSDIDTKEFELIEGDFSQESFTDPDEATVEIEAAQRCHEIHILSTKNWPETKTVMERKCKIVLNQRICVDWPQIYRRTSTLGVYLDVCHSELASIGRDIENCAKEAIISGGVIAIVTGGNFAAAAAVVKKYLYKCLTSKGLGHLSGLNVKITSKKKTGRWKKI